MSMLEKFWQVVRESKWANYLKAWWKGHYDLIDGFPVRMREKYITGGLMLQPFHLVFNGAGFANNFNTPWKNAWEIYDVILFAPVLRREILPHEIVFDIDAENEEHAIKRARWVKAALETLGIDFSLGFSGRRGFHFDVIIEPSTPLPEELPPNFSLNTFRQAIFNLVVNIAGWDGLDTVSSGLRGRHAVREFFQSTKRLCFSKFLLKSLSLSDMNFRASSTTTGGLAIRFGNLVRTSSTSFLKKSREWLRKRRRETGSYRQRGRAKSAEKEQSAQGGGSKEFLLISQLLKNTAN